MNRLKRDPLVGAVILAAVLTTGLETWLLRQTSQQARRSLTVLEQKKRERDGLQRQSPGPSEENERAIRRELAGARERLAAAQAALTGGEARILAASTPAKPIDAYFDVADFVEKTRSLAAQAQVAIRPDERFGFSSHASEGPGTDLLPAVFRQRVAVQFLVGALFDAHPTALLSVQREHPLTAMQRAQRNQTLRDGTTAPKPSTQRDEPADFFELTQPISLRVPGKVDTEAFKLEFSGQTRALRAFLNRLASGELPLVVRSVEAETLSPAATAMGTGLSPAAVAPVPIVTQAVSRFRVVVEFIMPPGEAERPEL